VGKVDDDVVNVLTMVARVVRVLSWWLDGKESGKVGRKIAQLDNS
jgi:hypothetical protein